MDTIIIMAQCIMKAVRESMNTRMTIGTEQNGTMKTWKNLCDTMKDARMQNNTGSVYKRAALRMLSK